MAQPKSVSATNFDGAQGSVLYDKNPDECPICHKGMNPRVISAVVLGEFNQPDSKLRIIFQCPLSECHETFFGFYTGRQDGSLVFHDFEKASPSAPPPANFPDSVINISSNFISIYNQAIAAEVAGLDQISGIGLRKALEFLIKDFLIHENPNEAATIKTKFLGACINDDITDANVKACAARATWLGNDETHYVRKWEDRDINDLKTLIRLTVNWIDNVLLTQEYLREMDPSNLPKSTP